MSLSVQYSSVIFCKEFNHTRVLKKVYMAAHKVNRPFTLRNGEFSFWKQAPYGQKNE